jgi:hypothetical protein
MATKSLMILFIVLLFAVQIQVCALFNVVREEQTVSDKRWGAIISKIVPKQEPCPEAEMMMMPSEQDDEVPNIPGFTGWKEKVPCEDH